MTAMTAMTDPLFTGTSCYDGKKVAMTENRVAMTERLRTAKKYCPGGFFEYFGYAAMVG